ncbi:hypothetical protein B296_00049237 [Ensete ventricosum]|uniref:Retrotransposon gag domain-containing protein n=1 Tax=Ensete ventricosum TaxID=4639 RepID=A0A426Y2A7_ENSVE|nr:hypothetical protein B296_00049237 [Ensete ventricosum]
MPLIRQQKEMNIIDLQSYALASDNALDARFEDFEARMEDRLRALFHEFRIGRLESPNISQCRESSDRKENKSENGDQVQDSRYPRMRVEFPRWEDGDPTKWISCAERSYFQKTPKGSMVDIIVIHLEGDAIQWYDWFQHTHGRSAKGLCWHRDEPWSKDHPCKRGRLLMIEPIEDPEPKPVEEEAEPVISTVHALAGYANTQTMKIEGFLNHQPVTILIDTESTNNFMDNKVATRLTYRVEDCDKFDVKVADGRTLSCDHKCPWVKLIMQPRDNRGLFLVIVGRLRSGARH